jgi:hypothetical protein
LIKVTHNFVTISRGTAAIQSSETFLVANCSQLRAFDRANPGPRR